MPPDPEDDQNEIELEPVPEGDPEQVELPLDEDEEDQSQEHVGLQFDDEPPKVLQFEFDDEPPKVLQFEFDDEPPKVLQFEFDDEPGTAADDEPSPDDVQKPLEQAKDLLARARLVSDPLFKEARKDGLQFDDEPVAAGAVEELPPPDVQNSLEEAESLVNRSRLVSNPLFKEVRRMPEYGRVLATRERCAQFERKLLRTARMIDSRLGTKLPADTLDKVVERLANRFAAWEHSHDLQKGRQKKQVLKRQRHNRGRDLQIVRYIENGESQRKVADRLGTTRWVVQHVLKRDAQHLLKRNKPPKPPD